MFKSDMLSFESVNYQMLSFKKIDAIVPKVPGIWELIFLNFP